VFTHISSRGAVTPVGARDGATIIKAKPPPMIRKTTDGVSLLRHDGAKGSSCCSDRFWRMKIGRFSGCRAGADGSPSVPIRPAVCPMPSAMDGRALASDPKVDTTFGIDPMLLYLLGASSGAKNRIRFFARCAGKLMVAPARLKESGPAGA